MPRFDFQCQYCDNEFDYLIVHSEDKPHCPNCGSQQLEKKVSLFSVGNSSPKHKTMEKVRRLNAEAKESKKKTKPHVGCARGYANKLLQNYK